MGPKTGEDLNTNHLALLSPVKPVIKINQAIGVYDTTFGSRQSGPDAPLPSSNKYYEWTVIPANGCDSMVGEKNNILAEFIFRCSGTYSITAKVYDSLRQELIGITDTLEIQVGSDTLYPSQSIKTDDTLILQTTLFNGLPSQNPTILVNFITTKDYDDDQSALWLNYTSDIAPNDYNFLFSDITLSSYPFASESYNATHKAKAWAWLDGFSYGVPGRVSVTWLGTIYTGTITVIDAQNYTFDWDNSGAVIMKKK